MRYTVCGRKYGIRIPVCGQKKLEQCPLCGPCKLSKKRIAKEAFIREIMEEYERGVIDPYEYVKNVSRKFLPQN